MFHFNGKEYIIQKNFKATVFHEIDINFQKLFKRFI